MVHNLNLNLCCTSPHQQSAWPWQRFNQPPALLFCLNNPALFRNSRASVGCWKLPEAMISPEVARMASCRALLCSFSLVTHHVFSFRCCWSACIAHQYTLFFMRWPASRARNDLFFLLVWRFSISTIQSPIVLVGLGFPTGSASVGAHTGYIS